MASYFDSVQSFEHKALAELPSYARVRQALSDLLNEVEGLPLSDGLRSVADMALTAPYADCCERCSGRAWPHAVDRVGDWLNCQYRCANCDCEWVCGYGVAAPYYFSA